MKKKIYKYVSVTVIAVAMVVSFQISKDDNKPYLLTLAEAQACINTGIEGPMGMTLWCNCSFPNMECVETFRDGYWITYYGYPEYH